MKGRGAAILLALLAACGRGQPTAEDAAAENAGAVGTTADPAVRTRGGSTLTRRVSALTARVSPFQVHQTPTATIVELAADVLFAFDSDRLAAGAPEQLRRATALIAAGGPGPIAVTGHTDTVGSAADNDDLSLRRARAVAAWLGSEGGIPAGRLKTAGRGEREPVAPDRLADGSDNPDGRARNRRVTITIPKG